MKNQTAKYVCTTPGVTFTISLHKGKKDISVVARMREPEKPPETGMREWFEISDPESEKKAEAYFRKLCKDAEGEGWALERRSAKGAGFDKIPAPPKARSGNGAAAVTPAPTSKSRK